MAPYRPQCQSMKFASRRRRSTSNRRVPPCRLRAYSEFGQDRTPIELDRSFLVGLAGVDVDDCRAAVEQSVDRFDVRSGICPDSPFAVDLFERHLAFGALLNLGRVRDVVIFLEGLRQKAPQFGRLLRLVLVADDDKLL